MVIKIQLINGTIIDYNCIYWGSSGGYVIHSRVKDIIKYVT